MLAFTVTALLSSSVLQGDWVSDCYYRGGSSHRDKVVFAVADIQYFRTFFDDRACTVPTFQYIVGGTYVVADGAPDALDVTIRSADIVLYDYWLVTVFRRERYCGHAYWAVGEPLPMLGDICGDDTEPQFY